MITSKGLWINGQWQKGEGLSFASLNPATGEKVWQGAGASLAQVEQAVVAAKEAFEQWSSQSLEKRLLYLKQFGAGLQQIAPRLADMICQETGKPYWEGLAEVQAMHQKIALSIQAFKERCPFKQQAQASALSLTRHQPHGVIAILGPFNFPGHLPNGHLIPALLAGNTVIFKPSDYTPGTAEVLMECWQQTDLPTGVINLLQGAKEVGQPLATHASINGLFFTGSFSTGQLLHRQFAGYPEKMLALEMGGNNPLIVSAVEDVTAAAYLTIQSAYLTAGQRCTCAKRLIVIEGAKSEAFIAKLIEMIAQLKIGTYRETPAPFMGPVISAQVAKDLVAIQERLYRAGGLALIKLKSLKADTGLVTPGLIDVTASAKRPDEEIFGPLLQLIRVKDFTAALIEANQTAYGLAAGLLSDSQPEFEQFYQKIRAGIVNWNMPLTGASSAAPFGGIGQSGNHRPSAYYAADYCSYPVASLIQQKLTLPTSLLPGLIN